MIAKERWTRELVTALLPCDLTDLALGRVMHKPWICQRRRYR